MTFQVEMRFVSPGSSETQATSGSGDYCIDVKHKGSTAARFCFVLSPASHLDKIPRDLEDASFTKLQDAPVWIQTAPSVSFTQRVKGDISCLALFNPEEAICVVCFRATTSSRQSPSNLGWLD